MTTHEIVPLKQTETDDDEDDYDPDARIHWIGIIFLPFNWCFQLIVIICVVIKCYFGPLQTVYPFMECSEIWEKNDYLKMLKYFYHYGVDTIYLFDTFLYIMHRQLSSEAVRAEHLPKPIFFIILDLLSLIPFLRLVSSELCPKKRIWPNILGTGDFLVIYRLMFYFSLTMTHSILKLLFGYVLIAILTTNFLVCIFLLLTYQGLCGHCASKANLDWRQIMVFRSQNQTELRTYFTAFEQFSQIFLGKFYDKILVNTYLEFLITSIVMIFAYLTFIIFIRPKLYAERIFHSRRWSEYHPRITKVIEETKRRNPLRCKTVQYFYTLLWEKTQGISKMPDIITTLPTYLRVYVLQDLAGPVFYHSPTFRKTSQAFKRWLCEKIIIDLKLSGEEFFTGPHCMTNLYYIKSGIVQFMANDDIGTSYLSVTSGTIFGDISFYNPPFHRNAFVRCLTNCEICVISRENILKCLWMFPEDRRNIIRMAKERIEHGRALNACKHYVKGLDRSEEEGIAWIKMRWWDISNTISKWKKSKAATKELPREPLEYHCSKYIGQLVLCSEYQLKRKNMFITFKFPFILTAHNLFSKVWYRIVLATVYIVILIYPSNLTRIDNPLWFAYFKFIVDIIYAMDILVTLITSQKRREGSGFEGTANVMLARFKTPYFYLDIMSTAWIERAVAMVGLPTHNMIQCNRFIKSYMLFFDKHEIIWRKEEHPFKRTTFLINLIHFIFWYLSSFIVYEIYQLWPEWFSEEFIFNKICVVTHSKCKANQSTLTSSLILVTVWIYHQFNNTISTFKITDLGMIFVVIGYLLCVSSKTLFVASFYLSAKETIDYIHFTSNIRNNYRRNQIHPDLMKRLERYFNCHWKYYRGMDILQPHLLRNEPYGIYWKIQGEIAKNIIKQTPVLIGASPALIEDLTTKANFLIFPKYAAILLFGVECKNIYWIVNGVVLCEYHDNEGELQKCYYRDGDILSVRAFFSGKASLRNYIAATDCEILYIPTKEFYKVYQRHLQQWANLKEILDEFAPIFDKVFVYYVRKHQMYQQRERDKLKDSKKTVLETKPKALQRFYKCLRAFREDPESRFIKFWMAFRAILVAISIISSTIKVGSGAFHRYYFEVVTIIVNILGIVDIFLKFFLPFYDIRGLIITDIRKCAIHYLTRGFLVDCLSTIPWVTTFSTLINLNISENDIMIAQCVLKFCSIYLLIGYFDYLADCVDGKYVFIKIFKWQVVTLLLIFGACQYFTSKCVEFTWDPGLVVQNITYKDNCWMPKYLYIEKNPTADQLHLIYAIAMFMTQCTIIRVVQGFINVDETDYQFGVMFIIFGIFFWFLMSSTETLLLLSIRGQSEFRHEIERLQIFLKSERVEPDILEKSISHFRYSWLRSKGLHFNNMMTDRLGLVFRQDLGHFFFKKTFSALDTILGGGMLLGQKLAGNVKEIYYRSGEDIIREMDIVSSLYIVHRGNVVITRKGHRLALLTKGCIFGQLLGTKLYPLHISASAKNHVDLLEISVDEFQRIINDTVRENIANVPESQMGYLPVKKRIIENAYNTVDYLMRGEKIIKLPWMKTAVQALSSKWYSKWLIIAWIVGPGLTIMHTLYMHSMPVCACHRKLLVWVAPLDIIHLLNFVSEFFTMELVVEENKCVYKYVRFNHFKRLGFYFDIISLTFPLLTFVTNDQWGYQMTRILRAHLFFEYHRQTKRSYQAGSTSIVMKLGIGLLLIHALACGWITVACRHKSPYPKPNILGNKTLDFQEWKVIATENGCSRIVKGKNIALSPSILTFAIPTYWHADYVIALTHVLIYLLKLNLDITLPTHLPAAYYNIFVSLTMHLFDIWISSEAVSAFFTKYNEMYKQDYKMSSFFLYLRHHEVNNAILGHLKKYGNMMRLKQRGGLWIPELVTHAPLCLREDIYKSLYMHHLLVPKVFQKLPDYFLRQMVTRLTRIMVFNGKNIVNEGDVIPCIYFIHEGEVEKWYTDASGEHKLVSVLTTNGYFGLIPGIFPNTAFRFSYKSRTNLDLITLKYNDWQDLLNAYPDVKKSIYDAATKRK